MSDNQDQPRGGFDPADPWAPPNREGVELSKSASAPGQDPQSAPGQDPQSAPGQDPRPEVHDQQTVTSVPVTPEPEGAVPPPPVAPTGPAAAGYGYPAAGAPGGYGYPTAPAAPTGASGYGYPGYPSTPYGGQPGWQQAPSNGMGTTAMVLGIISVAGFCLYGLGAVLGILALIFGIIGVKKAGRGEATNRGMAVAGIVLGAIGTLISAVFLSFIVWAIAQGEEYDDSGTDDPFASSLVIENGR
ncbi:MULTISPECIES: DUF4190 domain-containing protein [unclassified Streptomyces]|uniref:DUF4190 domain-containing protein n=1 Tax=unclassified Streptomyces TaxID=2593676 RepID=UPI0016605B9B|nr:MULTISPECIES: DUF4190 domain-containing protein [unclassified Streptomyces]MBD0711350.1 hypothetical protein [Streptomyces sp. CBMA291]MBD0718087.1 hypothetical protein [Streptomyces sp. CBMA370]